jgi:hypothetical protein
MSGGGVKVRVKTFIFFAVQVFWVRIVLYLLRFVNG